jgi:hypothetical protein
VNKLGFYLHLSTDQDGLWDAIGRAQPPAILFHADTANNMLLQEIRRWRSPNAFVIGRMFKDLATERALLDNDDPAGAGHRYAEEIVNYDFGMASKREGDRLLIDAWMSLNECLPGPASATFKEEEARLRRLYDHYDLFQEAFLRRMREAGLEAVAFNFAAGNFTAPEHYLDFFPRTLAAYRYLGFHEYGWPALAPGPGVASGACVYRTVMEGARARYGDQHRVIITEAGLTRAYGHPQNPDRGWLDGEESRSQDDYWQSLAWYNDRLAEDPYVIGACLYQVGHAGDWATFRHLGSDNQGQPLQLIDRIAALQAHAPALPKPALPLPVPPPATVAGRVLANGKPVVGAVVRLVGSEELLGGAPDAMLFAPRPASWTRRATGIAGTPAQVYRRHVAGKAAGIAAAEFVRAAARFNPSLKESGGRFVAGATYLLPENNAPGEIVWDRPLRGFTGTVRQAWRRFVEGKVAGLAYGDFRRGLREQNPAPAAGDGRLHAAERYMLPRNAGQKEYTLTAVSGRGGRFRFRNLLPGAYRLEVTAPGYSRAVLAVDAAHNVALDVVLERPAKAGLGVNVPMDVQVGQLPFMRMVGGQFVRGDRPFRFVGVNIRGLLHYGNGQDPIKFSAESHRVDNLRAAYDMGARVARVFLADRHADTDTIIRRMNATLQLLREQFPEMYLLPALTNLYSDVPFHVPGDDPFYQQPPGDNHALLNRDFFTGGFEQNYWPFVQRVVGAFANEPRIFAWEIGNELKLDREPQLFIGFMHEIARRIRALDPNHLITTGMISTRHAWLFEPDAKATLYGSPYLDFVTFHAYEYEPGRREDDRDVAVAVRKPFVVEEAGFMGNDRGERVRNDLNDFYGRGAAGYMPWGFNAVRDTGDGDLVLGMERQGPFNDWDALVGVFRERAAILQNEDQDDPPVIPPEPARPVPATLPTFTLNQQIFTAADVNVRSAPGLAGQVLGTLAPNSPLTVIGPAQAADSLTWWPVRASLPDGRTVDGWCAQANSSVVLLRA